MADSTKLRKLIVLVGPTAAGKTAWSLALAKKFNGEIISADSRQIYKKMNIGTAKPAGEWRFNGLRRTFFVEGIAHYLLDFLDPGKSFSAAEWRDQALKSTKIVYKNQRVPMIIGGTGLYISTLVDNWQIPRVPPNPKLRASLEEKSAEELIAWIQKLDPAALKFLDVKNKRRLIRALEVSILSGEPFSAQRQKGEPLFDILQIGVEVTREVLHERIEARIDKMMADGLLKEVENLRRQKYGWQLSSMNSIGYRQFKPYFENEAPLEEIVNNLKRETKDFAKRQLTWFRRDPRIVWYNNLADAEAAVAKFLVS